MKKITLLFLSLLSFPIMAEEVPLTLEDCYQRALTHIESVAIQEEEIRAAEGRTWQAIGTALPHISAKGTEFIQDTAGNSSTGDSVGSSLLRQSKPEVSLHLKQPLFQGFREFRSISGSSADRQKARFDTERKGQLLFLEVTQVFLTVRQLENDLEILESQKKVMMDRTKELQGRVRLGKSRQSEVLTTESQAANLEAEIARVRGNLAITRETLSFMTGIRQDQKLANPETSIKELQPLEAYLNRSGTRGDVEASKENFRLSKAKLSYERGGYLPQLNVEGNYYPYRVGFQKDIQWDLLFTLDFPIFEGGQTFGKVREAKARLKQSELARSQSERQAELEIRQAYHDLITSREELRFLQIAVQKASQNYQAQAKEYRFNLVSNLEVLQALRDWHTVRRQANQAAERSLLNTYRFKVALGDTPLGGTQ